MTGYYTFKRGSCLLSGTHRTRRKSRWESKENSCMSYGSGSDEDLPLTASIASIHQCFECTFAMGKSSCQ